LLTFQSSLGQLASSGWAKYGANAGNTFQGTGKGAVGQAKWKFATFGGIDTNVVTGSNGDIYFGNNGGDLVAESSTHVLQWTLVLPGNYAGDPALGPDGTIYVASAFQLIAVTPAGAKKWTYNLAGSVVSAPVVGLDGAIYAVCSLYNGSECLGAIGTNGKLLWSLAYPASGSYPRPAAVIGPDGTIYASISKTQIEAIEPGGTEK